ncbi:MarR family transcriptional regulator [Desulfosporosinus sp. Sb-LF]|uniref:MarR family winged helix-turn-helix transcriptional regulator n=1 Tax=Desulfosporosinus sp. Sb-LF TaxID=2560027 RepID=UPI00107F4525|nr:MarR family transcriptional regulator [Desulfosporosinus sp. Sb-LF]TGE34675.1 MarR family transcriptional regulator [Desulfosporosinus sp. Sb-LF]
MSRFFVNKLNEQIAAYDLHHSQWMIVYYLKNFGASTLVDIANYMNVEKSSVTRTADRLEKNALIERIPVKDKRERRIQLTDLGEEVYTACRQIVDEFECNIMKGTTEEEQETVIKTMLRIRANLKNIGEINRNTQTEIVDSI